MTRATAQARAGRCAEALDTLSGAQASVAVSMLRGQCHFELKQYGAAVDAFDAAKAADPSAPHVDMRLGMAHFQLGDLGRAEQALGAAAATSQDRAEYHLYSGLLQLQRQPGDAARSLDRARSLSPAVEPTASYYAGLAYAGAEENESAIAALDRVIELAPGSVWAAEAAKAKERLEATEAGSWWAWARAGIEYDDNVTLRTHGSIRPEDFGSSHDARAVWTVHGGYEFLRERDWSAGVSLTYFGSAHFDLEDFNQQYPVLSLWVDRRLAETSTLRVRYDAGHAWIDGEPFLNSHTVTPTLFHDWGASGRSRLFGSLYKYNYLFDDDGEIPDGRGEPGSACLKSTTLFCSPPGVQEGQDRNRDGWGFSLGGQHTIPLGFLETELTGGLLYHRYSSRGSEYSYQAYEARIETASLLPWELHLRTRVSYTLRPYRNNSSFPDPRDIVFNREYPLQNENRRDDQWYGAIELEKYLTDELSVEIAWRYLKNHSNVVLFDYDRETTGIYVTYRFEE